MHDTNMATAQVAAAGADSPRLAAHAVVVGGSIAGLLAARVLADHVGWVTVLDRDDLPAHPADRRGVPQSPHQHVLLRSGRRVLDELLPDAAGVLEAAGAHELDLAADVAWLAPGGWSVPCRSTLTTWSCSRALLEWVVRDQVASLPNVEIRGAALVEGLLLDAHRQVRGVRVRRRGGGAGEVAAQLVVDAAGRSSSTPRWLRAAGLEVPQEVVVDAHVGYASRTYRAPADALGAWRGLVVQQAPPDLTRGGVLLPSEDGRWVMTLTGQAGDHPPRDEAGFDAFAASIRTPMLAEFVARAEPLTPITVFTSTANRLRRYDLLRRRVEGLLVLGDAACALNPVYAQGMSVAARTAATLAQVLRSHRQHPAGGVPGLARRFQVALARAVTPAWQLATAADRRVPGVQAPPRSGAEAAAARLQSAVLDRVVTRAVTDPQVRLRLLGVLNLEQPPASLLTASVLLAAARTSPVAVVKAPAPYPPQAWAPAAGAAMPAA